MPDGEPNESAVFKHRSESEGEGRGAAIHHATSTTPAPDSVERLSSKSDGMASPEGGRSRLSRWGWLGLVSLVLAIRLVAAWLGRDRLDSDPDAYRTLGRIWSVTGSFAVPATPLVPSATSEREGIEARSKATPRYDLVPDDGSLAVRPTAYRPPLYPAILALLDRCGGLNRWGIGLLQVLLGLVTAVLLASRLDRTLGWQAAMLGGVLVTCDPILLSQGTLVMTETLATTLVVAGGVLWAEAWQRRSEAGV